MARSFNGSTDRYLNTGSPLGDAPQTLAGWFYPNATGVGYTLIHHGPSGGGATVGFRLQTNTSSRVVARAGSGTAATTTSYTASTWHHAAAVFVSSTSRAAFLNGGGKGTDTTSSTPTGGQLALASQTGGGNKLAGRLAECAIWDTNLSDAEVLVLALGASPLLVRPQNLQAYWPLIGRTSPEIDLRGGYTMTASGSPAVADHIRVFYPTRSQRRLSAEAASYNDATTFSTTSGYAPAALADLRADLVASAEAGFTVAGLLDCFAALTVAAAPGYEPVTTQTMLESVVFPGSPTFDTQALVTLTEALNLLVEAGIAPETIATHLLNVLLDATPELAVDPEVLGTAAAGLYIPTWRPRRR